MAEFRYVFDFLALQRPLIFSKILKVPCHQNSPLWPSSRLAINEKVLPNLFLRVGSHNGGHKAVTNENHRFPKKIKRYLCFQELIQTRDYLWPSHTYRLRSIFLFYSLKKLIARISIKRVFNLITTITTPI